MIADKKPLITKALLDEIGVSLPDHEIELLSEHFETTLNERVINEITEELEVEQLQQLIDTHFDSESERAAWLQANVPALKEIIEDETAILIGELVEHSDRLA